MNIAFEYGLYVLKAIKIKPRQPVELIRSFLSPVGFCIYVNRILEIDSNISENVPPTGGFIV